MNPQTTTRLLASMNASRLLVVCGAGLSMAPPSGLPSAKSVAEQCFDKYRLESDPNCDAALREDLEALAEHFVAMNTLQSVFIESLVPWSDFVRPYNNGHAAIADFLITRAAVAAISSNYDTLIERSAWDYGADFQGSLDGDEAILCEVRQGPLLKVHGCSHRERRSTVWAPSQLTEPVIRERIDKSKVWMTAGLRQKDLLLVGFWSDWEYLNSIIGTALEGVDPRSVTVIDPLPTPELQVKAPELWDVAHGDNVAFEHVQESAAEALDELRRAFSASFLRQVLAAGQGTFEQTLGIDCNADWLKVSNADSEILYGWRRDAEGVPRSTPATKIRPDDSEALGFFHLLLRHAGASPHDNGYELNGRVVRVINGGQAVLATLKARFLEPPAINFADIVVAVGATELPLHENIVRRGEVADIVRPAAGGLWVDLQGARQELGI